MKIVIDIPEEYYNAIKSIPDRQCDADMLIIKSGTPLSEYCDHCAGDKVETEDD